MKNNEYLLYAIGGVDADLLERAAQRPAVTRRSALRWVAVAAALVVLVGMGMWFGTGNRWSPLVPIDGNSDPTPTVTDPPTTQPTENSDDGSGIGGDKWECPVHSELYHSLDGELYDYVSKLVGEERLKVYFEESKLDETNYDTTYPYLDCLYPNSGLPKFLEAFNITREQFIEAMGWGDFLDHVYQQGYPYFDDGHYYLFTYGEFVDALYGDDPHLTAWVFHDTVSYADEQKYQDFYYDDRVMFKRNGDPVWDYVYENYDSDARSQYEIVCNSVGGEDADNIIHLVQYFEISKEKFIELYGWENKLDEKATEHFPYAPYTYRQFVDAIYGEDATLCSWLFNKNVFHPDYPTLSEYATLSEGDRFYEAPLTVTPIKVCTEHSPKYHDLSYFPRKMVRAYQEAYKGKDIEELNILSFVEFHGITREQFVEYIGDFEGAEDEMDLIATNHGVGCPYTYTQFVNAIYGDDPALTAWVFAPASTWPVPEEWPECLSLKEWPPEGYGFPGEEDYTGALEDNTSTTFPERDEFGGTTTRSVQP